MTSSRSADASSWPGRRSIVGSARGHLAMKSGPFCPGSSSRIASQMMIEDQMTSHYNRISSAKAAVDSSLPKSLLTSVKYRDQQRRAWLRKEVRHAEKDLRSNPSLSRSGSRPASARTASPSRTWSPSPPPRCGSALALSSGFPSYAEAPRDAGRSSSPSPLLLLHGRDAARWADLRRHTRSQRGGGGASLPGSQRARSLLSCPSAGAASAPERPYRDARGRTFAGGDVLEKHAESFTTAERPFTPRMLRSDASAALLARTRHYAPPRRRARQPPPGKTFVERDVQTDPDSEDMYQTDANHARWVLEQARYTEGLEAPVRARDWFQATSLSPGPKSAAAERARLQEEELKYLQFIGQVTDDILAMGLFSNSVLVRVFERHVEKNRHRLEETKMRHMLEVLKSDLGMEKSREWGNSLPRDWRPDGSDGPLARSRDSLRRDGDDFDDSGGASPTRPAQERRARDGHGQHDRSRRPVDRWNGAGAEASPGHAHGSSGDGRGGRHRPSLATSDVLHGHGDASLELSGKRDDPGTREQDLGDFNIDAALDDSSPLLTDDGLDDLLAKYRHRRDLKYDRFGGLHREDEQASPQRTGASSPAEDTGKFPVTGESNREREDGGDPEPVGATENKIEERGSGLRRRSRQHAGASSPAEDTATVPVTDEREDGNDPEPVTGTENKVEGRDGAGEICPDAADAAVDDDDDFFGGAQTVHAGSGLKLGRTMVTQDIETLQKVLTSVLHIGDEETNGQCSADEEAGLGDEEGGDPERVSNDKEGGMSPAESEKDDAEARDEGEGNDDF
ncbi:spermatogenesis-associated protein 7 isoform X1 [Lethenteron reissneri]|uniref:spermatogenesis-associated protein 7 isoform X1 n=1 Tax=Lethenteron reissneri TaxID=7753 RepID=UPI002AB7E0AB|nr:spermatogenesis-associated protein 7 isoform X1 [Lethenteron reissneri]XP_061407328.1 spermatogenesis-associated protein 7 isoform X1 [Lethenteron reissneri]XP_061407329.1 spermatogenesis-associated protein 7 isoform X1 [Lethenteron reissneri]